MVNIFWEMLAVYLMVGDQLVYSVNIQDVVYN